MRDDAAERLAIALRAVRDHPARCGGAYCGDPDCDVLIEARAALVAWDAEKARSLSQGAPEPEGK